MKPTWLIRAYRDGDEERIFELWKAVNPTRNSSREQWLTWWAWKYKDNPAGNPIIWFAEYNDSLVGQYAVIPIKMKVGNGVFTCLQSVDTMTHPDYRKQGIFEALAKKTYEQAAGEEIHVIYGFPNELSYPGFVKKLDWFDVSLLKTMIKPLNLQNIVKNYISNRFLFSVFIPSGNLLLKILSINKRPSKVDALDINQISSFDDRFDNFWERISGVYDIGVVRDTAYLNWRFVNVPNTQYVIYIAERRDEILGYIILLCRELRGLLFSYIVDVVTLPGLKNVFQCLILKSIEHSNNENADILFHQVIGNEMYYNILRRNGFLSSRFIDRRFHFIARVNTSRVSETLIRNPDRWFVQIGDSDTV